MNSTQPRHLVRHVLTRVACALILLSLALSAWPQSAALAKTCKFKHKVKAGETLIYIGQLYQYDWREIAEANDLEEPYVLQVGATLCIPGGTKPTGTTTTTTTGETTESKKPPTLTVAAGISEVYIKVENFPKFIVYYVSVISDFSDESYRIGRLRTNKNGFFEDWFPIPPSEVRSTPTMAACVKNAWTDAVSCVEYENPFYAVQPFKIYWKHIGR